MPTEELCKCTPCFRFILASLSQGVMPATWKRVAIVTVRKDSLHPQAPGALLWAALAAGAPLAVTFSAYMLPAGGLSPHADRLLGDHCA